MILSKIYFKFNAIFDMNLVAISLLAEEEELSFYYNATPARCFHHSRQLHLERQTTQGESQVEPRWIVPLQLLIYLHHTVPDRRPKSSYQVSRRVFKPHWKTITLHGSITEIPGNKDIQYGRISQILGETATHSSCHNSFIVYPGSLVWGSIFKENFCYFLGLNWL